MEIINKEEFIKNIINEETKKLMSEGPKLNLSGISDDDDEDFNPDDEDGGLLSFFNQDDDESNDAVQNDGDDDIDPSLLKKGAKASKSVGKRGSAYNGEGSEGQRYMKTKNIVDTATADGRMDKFPELQKQREQFYTDPTLTNPYNKYRRDNHNPNSFGRIKCVFSQRNPSNSYPDGKYGLITLFNIEPFDCLEIVKQFSGKGHTERINTASSRFNHGKDGITFIVYDKYIDQWKETELPQIIDFLKSKVDDNGNPIYGTDEQMSELEQTIETKVFSDNDVDNYFTSSKDNNLEKYRNYLESEDDEEINSLIELFQRNGVMDSACRILNLPDSFGHILSWKNAKAIIGTGRNATFILPEAVWERVFGRVVKPGSKPFMIRIPRIKNLNGKWKNPAPIDYQYVDETGETKKAYLGSTEDILKTFYNGKSYGELSPQQKFFVNCLANIDNVKGSFILQEYDVADTVWDPSLNPVDVFNETIGLSNNIKRELNDKAKDALAQRQAEMDNEPQVDDDNGEESPENSDARMSNMINRTSTACENLMAYAKMNGMRFTPTPNDPSSALIDFLLRLSKQKIPTEQGITKESFVNELAKNAVYFVCKLERVALDRVNGLRQPIKITTDELSKFSNIVDILVDAIEGASINRTNKVALEEDDSAPEPFNFSNNKEFVQDKIEQFLTKLNGEAEKQQMNESFDKMLLRMDKSKTNLIY